MASDDKFLELLNQLAHAHTLQTDAAYERGREAGKREAMTQVRSRLAGLNDLFSGAPSDEADIPENSNDAIRDESSDADVSEPEGRAPPGSVKPIISDLIYGQPGLTTVEIRAITKLKPNSIRGTLWALSAQDKVIERREGRWYPTWNDHAADAGADHGDAEAQTNEAVGNASDEEAPTASVENAHLGVFN